MDAPPGVMSVNARSPSQVCVMFAVTFRSWIGCAVPTTIVLVAPVGLLSGIGTGPSVEVNVVTVLCPVRSA
jgi:hypothetical protein